MPRFASPSEGTPLLSSTKSRTFVSVCQSRDKSIPCVDTMPEILIRPATLEDTEFLVSGNASMALETEARTLDSHILRAGVCAVFDEPARGFYLIAEID